MTNRDIDPTKAIVGLKNGFVVAVDLDYSDETVLRYFHKGYSVVLMDAEEAKAKLMQRRPRPAVQQNESEACDE